MRVETDYARAEFLRDRILLKAVLYFTGEALEDDEDDDDEVSEPGKGGFPLVIPLISCNICAALVSKT